MSIGDPDIDGSEEEGAYEGDDYLQEVRRKKRRASLTVRLWQVGVLVGLLGAWQLVVEMEALSPLLSRSPADVWAYLREGVDNGELWSNTIATIQAVITAFVLASAAGVVVGIGLGLLPRAERVLNPFISGFNSMPRIALAPVFILYFGIEMSAKVALAFTLVFFIVLSAARAGVRSADAEILRLSTVLGASKLQLFTKVMLPVSVPAIFASLRLGLVYSLLGVVGSEIIASRDGLGQLIARYSGTFRLDAVYGILILLGLIAAALNQVMLQVESRILRWQAPSE